ncbi:hypothetical protein [Halobacillus litoralis]|uniref:hypothetical protein n=1 Tax=Halobacillus litoralis TaxID=45668 RepID=UPI001CD6E963|nr:hypothetical protein [Halobacillus litoralis]MCA1024441.1 hypothetical protein [Halobacillus litoralis]
MIKRFRNVAVFVFFLGVMFLTACSSSAFSGNGEMTRVDQEEVKDFVEKEKQGFLYIESPLESDQEDDEQKLEWINESAENQKINFYVFDYGSLENMDEVENYFQKLGQYSETFGYYENGELKSEFDFDDLESNAAVEQLETFFQEMKEKYSD